MKSQENQNKINRFTIDNPEVDDPKIDKKQSLQSKISNDVLNIAREAELAGINTEIIDELTNRYLYLNTSRQFKKKELPQTRPTFKVGIPHHRYWSPTAEDTPVSHFHGLQKVTFKARSTLSRRISQESLKKRSQQRVSSISAVPCIQAIESFDKKSTNKSEGVQKNVIVAEENVNDVIDQLNIIEEVDPIIKLPDSNNAITFFGFLGQMAMLLFLFATILWAVHSMSQELKDSWMLKVMLTLMMMKP